MAEEQETNIAEGQGKSKKGLLFIIIGAVVLIAVGVGVALMLMGGGDETADGEAEAVEEVAAPAEYLPLEPPMVVNFERSTAVRFLQVSMEVMARDKQVIDEVRLHMPVIRNNLNLILAQQDPAVIRTREGKEQLRAELLAEIQNILAAQGASGTVEDIYFTSFVMQ